MLTDATPYSTSMATTYCTALTEYTTPVRLGFGETILKCDS